MCCMENLSSELKDSSSRSKLENPSPFKADLRERLRLMTKFIATHCITTDECKIYEWKIVLTSIRRSSILRRFVFASKLLFRAQICSSINSCDSTEYYFAIVCMTDASCGEKYIVMKRFAICFKRENDWNVNESNKAVSVMLILLNSCRDWSEAFLFSIFAFIAFSAYMWCDSDIDFRLLLWERAQHAARRWSVGEVWLHIMIKNIFNQSFVNFSSRFAW